jgi:hypothetical protein
LRRRRRPEGHEQDGVTGLAARGMRRATPRWGGWRWSGQSNRSQRFRARSCLHGPTAGGALPPALPEAILQRRARLAMRRRSSTSHETLRSAATVARRCAPEDCCDVCRLPCAWRAAGPARRPAQRRVRQTEQVDRPDLRLPPPQLPGASNSASRVPSVAL